MSESNHSEMKAKLKDYIDTIFADTPRSERVEELRMEMVQNLYEKYDDFVAEGRTPAAAYNMAISSVGDVSTLLAEMAGTGSASTAPSVSGTAQAGSTGRATADPGLPPLSQEEKDTVRRYRLRSAILTAVAVALYILCVTPPILLVYNEVVGLVLMFGMIAVATGMLIFNSILKPDIMQNHFWYRRWGKTGLEEARNIMNRYRSRSAVLTSVSVALYILCWIPCVFLTQWGNLAPASLFFIVAVATALIIYSTMTKPEIMRHPGMISHANSGGSPMGTEDAQSAQSDRTYDEEEDEDEDEPKGSRGKVYKAISGALWMLTVVAYLAVSFATQGWAFTWLIFLIAVAVDNIIKALFDIRL